MSILVTYTLQESWKATFGNSHLAIISKSHPKTGSRKMLPFLLLLLLYADPAASNTGLIHARNWTQLLEP